MTTSTQHPSGLKVAYGAVMVRDGEVLLREPKNHFDGYVWTFPKGRPDPGETPEACAAREALEETGIRGIDPRRIPGEFEGGTTVNIYFLFTPIGDPVPFDDETASICWASWDEARTLIGQTRNSTGRARDLAVLEAAKAALDAT